MNQSPLFKKLLDGSAVQQIQPNPKGIVIHNKRVTRPARAKAYTALSKWHTQMKAFDAGTSQAAPDSELLVHAFKILAYESEVRSDFFVLKRPKPNKEGLTERWLDRECGYVLAVLRLVGGGIYITKNGDAEGHYYLRCDLGGVVYVSRLIHDVQPGDMVIEPKDHHDMRRSSFVGLKSHDTSQQSSRNGVKELKVFTLNFYRNRKCRNPSLYPAEFTEEMMMEMLEDGLRRLHALPLGANLRAGNDDSSNGSLMAG